MCRVLVLVLSSIVVGAALPAAADLPDPEHSEVNVSGNLYPCHFRFDPGGGFDVLEVEVVLRDVFDAPIPNCETRVTLQPDALAFCSCCPTTQTSVSDANGVVTFSFDQIGGRGQIDIVAEALCGPVLLPVQTISFTSADLEGGCQPEPIGIGIIDMGIWVGGLSNYREASDYNCDATVNVLDFGLWAAGLYRGCGPACD
jgi:hypothetical protein